MLKKLSTLIVLSCLIAAPCFAQTAAAPAAPSFGEILSKMMPMFVIVFLVFHFLIIRPQKAKDTQHATLLQGLKNGDSVVTSSGIIGRVAATAPEYVTLEVAPNVKIRVEAAHILKKDEPVKKQ